MGAGDLTTLALVYSWLGLKSDNGGPNDTLLSALITSASQFVNSYLSRNILSATYTERYKGNGRQTIILANAPVTAVTSVSWMGTTLTAPGDPIAGTPGFYFDTSGNARSLSLVGYWFPRHHPVQVVYTAGYSACPADIQQVVNELVGEAFRRRDHIGQSSKSLGGQEVISFSQADMNATNRTLLQQYKAVAPVATC